MKAHEAPAMSVIAKGRKLTPRLFASDTATENISTAAATFEITFVSATVPMKTAANAISLLPLPIFETTLAA